MKASLVLLLVLAGCGRPALPEVAEPDVPASCREQVYDDPAVKAAILQANNSQFAEFRVPGVAAQKQAVAVALRKCLSGRGLVPKGGVEQLRAN